MPCAPLASFSKISGNYAITSSSNAVKRPWPASFVDRGRVPARMSMSMRCMTMPGAAKWFWSGVKYSKNTITGFKRKSKDTDRGKRRWRPRSRDWFWKKRGDRTEAINFCITLALGSILFVLWFHNDFPTFIIVQNEYIKFTSFLKLHYKCQFIGKKCLKNTVNIIKTTTRNY